MNRAYTPTRRAFTSCYIPAAHDSDGKLLSVVAASLAARVPNYGLDDSVEWDLGDGHGKQCGRVVMMSPSVTVVKQASGKVARLAPDRPRKVGT